MALCSSRTEGWHVPVDATPLLRDYAVRLARRHGASEVEANAVATLALFRLNAAAARNVGVYDLLSGPNWRRLIADTTRTIITAQRRAEAAAQSPDEVKRIKRQLAEREQLEVAVRLEELSAGLDRKEKIFLHLRYLQGMRMDQIARRLGCTALQAQHIGRSAHVKVQRAILGGRSTSVGRRNQSQASRSF